MLNVLVKVSMLNILEFSVFQRVHTAHKSQPAYTALFFMHSTILSASFAIMSSMVLCLPQFFFLSLSLSLSLSLPLSYALYCYILVVETCLPGMPNPYLRSTSASPGSRRCSSAWTTSRRLAAPAAACPPPGCLTPLNLQVLIHPVIKCIFM